MPIVYLHKRKDDGKVFYAGIGKTEKRAYDKNNRGRYWKNYVLSCEYDVEITHKDIIWEEACAIEKYLIAFYGRRDLGLGSLVNQTDGGEGVINIGLETRQKMSEHCKKNNIKPPTRKGLPGTFLGKKHSEESKEKNRQSHLGKISLLKGKKITEERKKKISEYNKKNGIVPPNRKGVVYPKISCSCCKKLIAVNNINKHLKFCKNKI